MGFGAAPTPGRATELWILSAVVFNRLFGIVAGGSAALAVLIVAAWLVAGQVDPRRHFVSLSRRCHFSVDARGADARLEVFNDVNYGPYRGSIVAIEGDPLGPTKSAVGDSAGIYYRHFRWSSGESLWTLSLSLAYPLMASLLLPVFWTVRHMRRLA